MKGDIALGMAHGKTNNEGNGVAYLIRISWCLFALSLHLLVYATIDCTRIISVV